MGTSIDYHDEILTDDEDDYNRTVYCTNSDCAGEGSADASIEDAELNAYYTKPYSSYDPYESYDSEPPATTVEVEVIDLELPDSKITTSKPFTTSPIDPPRS